MKHIITLTALAVLLLSACKSLQKTTSHTTTQKDSVNSQADSRSTTSIEHTSTLEKKDTAIGIAGKSVSDTLTAEQTEPVVTKSGKKQPRQYSKKDNGVTAWVVLDTNGKIYYGAETDSITMVVTNLITERDRWKFLYDSQKIANIFRKETDTTVDNTLIVEKKTFWGIAWPYALAGLVIGVLALILYIRFGTKRGY
jgi:hypothetical protein